jgi:hypothetical protein
LSPGFKPNLVLGWAAALFALSFFRFYYYDIFEIAECLESWEFFEALDSAEPGLEDLSFPFVLAFHFFLIY